MYCVESLQFHCIHTLSHWSSGLPGCFPSWGTRVQSTRGYLCKTGILLLAFSCYIGDPNVIDHCGLVWGGLRPEPSLGCHADNVIIPHDLTQLFCPGFTLAAGPPSGFTTNIVGCWWGALWRACNLTAFIPCLTGPVMRDLGSIPGGKLMWNLDSPVSIVSLPQQGIGEWAWRQILSMIHNVSFRFLHHCTVSSIILVYLSSTSNKIDGCRTLKIICWKPKPTFGILSSSKQFRYCVRASPILPQVE